MTNKIALILAVIIIAAIFFDQIFDWGRTEFMARKFLELVNWVEFWR